MLLPDGRVRKFRTTSCQPGEVHELTFCCFQRLPLLSKDRTRRWFVDAVAKAREKLGFELWAYVVMPEHVHLLLQLPDQPRDTAAILKQVKQPVAQRAMAFLRTEDPAFLERLAVAWPDGRTEHRFWQQGGGYDRTMTRLETVRAAIDYIHANPVRRGLVSSPIDWLWSSARAYEQLDDVKLAIDVPPPEVLGTAR